MKNLCKLILFLFPVYIYAQPQGKLFIHSGFLTNNELGYIQYPQNQYHIVDTTEMDDMIIVNNKLLLSNNKIYIYDIAQLRKTDSINTTNVTLMDFKNNKLAVVRTQPPYFEVYDFTTKNLIFSLNTNKVATVPVDVLVDLDKAYLLFENSITVVDLNLHDTIANSMIFPQFSFPAYSQYLVNKGNKIYIDVEIASGAPRFAIFSYDKTSGQIIQELFKEFIDTPFEPVSSNNRLYMSTFPSYYDFAADTFIYNQSNPSTYPISFDENSQSIFLYRPLDLKISYFNNDAYSSSASIPNYMNKAVFYNEGSIGIAAVDKPAALLSLYPNPANKELNIELYDEAFVKEIRITSLKGTHIVKSVNKRIHQMMLNINALGEGWYFVEVQLENQIYKSKFIKSKTN
ncbi:MAG: T9SS type A sorting domain-containing protein [Bacteroidetes bacterium]|nr:T9SS type A sorting domain-containing protein [Bacteroidota bacterium]